MSLWEMKEGKTLFEEAATLHNKDDITNPW